MYVYSYAFLKNYWCFTASLPIYLTITGSDGCYVCGNNSAGQLGLENVTSTSTWTHLHFEDSICEVSAGENHSMFLTGYLTIMDLFN